MIAAGEVVEGPFSVVKELIENSVDAGASHVDIQVYDSGLKKIMVRDDGSGIVREDIPLAIQEHATSKITDISGLNSVMTYGFRGEALSSIASISDIVILSKTADEQTGSRLESSAGRVSVTDFAGNTGTTVIVENLFFNMPARKKFLKSKKTELRSIRDTIMAMALPAFDVSFTLEVDDRREFTLPAAKSQDERVAQIFGKTVMQSLFVEELFDLKVRMKGYLSKPDFMRGSKNMQFFYVNGRAVEYRFLSFHLSRAYDAVIPKGKYPAALIFTEIDPELIDVNIHPAKREVKLFDQRYMDEMVFNLASKCLNRPHQLPEAFFRNRVSEPEPFEAADQSRPEPERELHAVKIEAVNHEEEVSALSLFEPVADDIPMQRNIAADPGRKILGTIFGTYIIVEDNDRLHMIDFHAAHERMIYDNLISGRVDIEYQELLFPVTVDLALGELRLVKDNMDVFNGIGFEIEEFSDYTVIVRTAPVIAGKEKIDELVKNMIDNIKDGIKSNDLNERFYSLVACHSAKRSGDRLSDSDMTELVRMVLDGSFELRCPHGRPFLYTLNRSDLERIFKRI